MRESALTIAMWADETFGPASSNLRAAVRANEEMSELLKALAIKDNDEEAVDEIADIVIVLCRVSRNLGCYDLWGRVERKMEINRQRKWKTDGTGHGYHE